MKERNTEVRGCNEIFTEKHFSLGLGLPALFEIELPQLFDLMLSPLAEN